MRFNNPDHITKELTFDDVFLFQQLSDIKSRTQVNITPNPLSTTIPIISSNMNSVTWKRMAQKLARLWWLWVLPQDMSLEKTLKVIDSVHNSDIRLDEPLTLTEEDTIRDALWIINKRSHQGIILIDKNNKPLAVYKESDFYWLDQYTKIKDIKKRALIVWEKWINDEEAFNIMEDNWISSLPIVENWILIWILTRDDTIRNSIYNPSLNKNWQLDLAIALSLNSYNERIEHLVNSWINTIFLDTAHWYTTKMLDAIKKVRAKYQDIILIAWNVMWWDWTEALLKAWANWVKVWIWPWAMCTTRMMTWVWRPQVSAILESVEASKEYGWFIIADWWIKYPRDLIIALALWASHWMLWTLLAWTYESPWDIMEDKDWKYKQNWWMASWKAVTWRTKDLSRFEQARRERFREWISTWRIYNPKPLWDVIDKFTTWLSSAMTYTWAKNLEEFSNKAKLWVQTTAWFQEWTPHWEIKK